MEHPRRNSLLLLPAFLLLAATACQESLPPFPEPGIELSARIVLDSRVETFGTPWPFLVEVLNVSDPQGTDAFILPPPFSVSVWVDVHHAKDPSRHIVVGRKVDITERLDPGGRLRVEVPFPAYDANGDPWRALDLTSNEHELVFQGTVRLPDFDLVIRTPVKRTVLVYGGGSSLH
jgi:hypothetical protein